MDFNELITVITKAASEHREMVFAHFSREQPEIARELTRQLAIFEKFQQREMEGVKRKRAKGTITMRSPEDEKVKVYRRMIENVKNAHQDQDNKRHLDEFSLPPITTGMTLKQLVETDEQYNRVHFSVHKLELSVVRERGRIWQLGRNQFAMDRGVPPGKKFPTDLAREWQALVEEKTKRSVQTITKWIEFYHMCDVYPSVVLAGMSYDVLVQHRKYIVETILVKPEDIELMSGDVCGEDFRVRLEPVKATVNTDFSANQLVKRMKTIEVDCIEELTEACKEEDIGESDDDEEEEEEEQEEGGKSRGKGKSAGKEKEDENMGDAEKEEERGGGADTKAEKSGEAGAVGGVVDQFEKMSMPSYSHYGVMTTTGTGEEELKQLECPE